MNNKSLIRLTRQFRFEAAHALWNYDGPCSSIHGHSYVLYVSVAGTPCDDPADPKYGMVMDFTALKKLVNGQIIDEFDHALMINAASPHMEMVGNGKIFGKILPLPYQPTCENMLSDFAARLQKALPAGISLHSLRLHETATSYAEWHASDNA